MAGRHLSRSIVMQTLFEWEFRKLDQKQAQDVLLRNIEEFAPGLKDDVFMGSILNGIIDKQDSIDDVIVKAAPDWPLEKIATIDRNVLRIGLFELLYGEQKEVPPKVAINEAIELAKSFGGDSSGRFVNGVLGSVYRELGEPGKDQKSKSKEEIPYEKMEIEKLGGAVIYAAHEGDIHMAFVHDIFGHWTLSKGHIDVTKDENKEILAKIKEEIGLDIELEEKLGDNEYISSHPEKGKLRKQVVYYLAKSNYQELHLPESKKGLDGAEWFKLGDIVSLNFYEDIFPIVTKAVGILLKQNEN